MNQAQARLQVLAFVSIFYGSRPLLIVVFFVFYRYLLDMRWYKQLRKYVGLDVESGGSAEVVAGDPSQHPGPIDNSSLYKQDDPDDIREHMIDEIDYNLVPEEGWKILVEEFGTVPDQKPVARKVACPMVESNAEKT